MGSRGLKMTMNGMDRKVAEQSVALKCNGEKRKPLAAGFGLKQFMAGTLDGWWGFLWLFPATMLIKMMLTEYTGWVGYVRLLYIA